MTHKDIEKQFSEETKEPILFLESRYSKEYVNWLVNRIITLEEEGLQLAKDHLQSIREMNNQVSEINAQLDNLLNN